MKEIELNATNPYFVWEELKKSYESEDQSDNCILIPEKFGKGILNFHYFTNDIYKYQISCMPLQENCFRMNNTESNNKFMFLMLYLGNKDGLDFENKNIERIDLNKSLKESEEKKFFHGFISWFEKPIEFRVKPQREFKLIIFLIKKKWIGKINPVLINLKEKHPVCVTDYSSHFKVGDSIMSYDSIFKMLDDINVYGVDLKTVGEFYILLGNYLNLIIQSLTKGEGMSNSKITSTDLRLLVKLENYLETNVFEKPVSLPKLSKVIGTSKTKMCQLFKIAKGTTIQRYFIAIKMEKAKDLLTDREKSITEIAYTLKITNNSYFTRLFKSHTGYLPSEFRELTALESIKKG